MAKQAQTRGKSAVRSSHLSAAALKALNDAERGGAKARGEVAEELRKEQPGKGHGSGKKEKGVPVDKSYISKGKHDAEALLEAAEGFGKTRMEILQGCADMTEDQHKAYVRGMKAYQNAQDEGSDRYVTLRTLISEFKRIFHAYTVWGTEKTLAHLQGKGTWREKIKATPTVTSGGQGKARKGKRKAVSTQGTEKLPTFDNLPELMQAIEKQKPDQKKGAQPPVGEVSEETIRNVVIYGMTDKMIPRLFGNLIAKCRMSTDKFWNEMGRELQKTWEGKIKSDGREEQITGKQAQAKAA